MEPDHNTNSSL